MGATASFENMTARDVGTAVASMGENFVDLGAVLEKNGWDGEVVASAQTDDDFKAMLDTLEVERKQRIPLTTKWRRLNGTPIQKQRVHFVDDKPPDQTRGSGRTLEKLEPLWGAASLWRCDGAGVQEWLASNNLPTCATPLAGFDGRQLVREAMPSLKPRLLERGVSHGTFAKLRHALRNEGHTYYQLAARHVETNPISPLLNWQWEKQLGSGHFGTCHLLRRKGDASETACVKFVDTQEHGLDTETASKEVLLMRELSSQHIVKIRESGYIDGSMLFLMMDFCAGGTLNQRLRRSGAVASPVLWRWWVELLCGLRDLHAENIVHRDLKTDNVFLTSGDDACASCRIGDLGLATRVSSGSAVLHTFAGTEATMAPEVLARQPYSRSADIWSMLVLLYETLRGAASFTWTMHSDAQLLGQLSGQPDCFQTTVALMLQRVPAERPTARQVVEHAEAYDLHARESDQAQRRSEDPRLRVRENLTQLFAMLDVDGSGEVDKLEFFMLLRYWHDVSAKEIKGPAAGDKSRSEASSPTRTTAGASELIHRTDMELHQTADRIVRMLDEDENGEISLEELLQWADSHPELEENPDINMFSLLLALAADADANVTRRSFAREPEDDEPSGVTFASTAQGARRTLKELQRLGPEALRDELARGGLPTDGCTVDLARRLMDAELKESQQRTRTQLRAPSL